MCVCCVYMFLYVCICVCVCVCVWLCETVWELTCLASGTVANGMHFCAWQKMVSANIKWDWSHTRIRVGVGGTGNEVWAGRYS